MIRTLAYRTGQCLTWIGGTALLALWRIAVVALATTGAGVALWVGCGPETTAEYGQ